MGEVALFNEGVRPDRTDQLVLPHRVAAPRHLTILEIETDNEVCYLDDLTDPAKKATSPAIAPRASTEIRYRTFKMNLCIADIVAVSGKPVRGYYVQTWTQVLAATELTPPRTIADVSGNCATDMRWVILAPDGTRIGMIIAEGLGGTTAPPGATTTTTTHDMAVVGGTGAFLGARGQAGRARAAGGRSSTMAEDPAYRRINGGGKRIEILHLIPMTWPEVMAIPTGPAIFHGEDFSPVTAEKPARAGELLVMSVSGLGPVRPNLDPGKPFPAWAAGREHVVNSPVNVTVNGKAAQVISAIGWPGMNNVYRVDFRVPEATAAGTAALGLSVAWINGPEVKFPVR